MQEDQKNKEVTFKSCASFTNCITELNKTKIYNINDIDNVIPMHNLIEYSGNSSKTSGRLWKYDKNEPNATIKDYETFKFKAKIAGSTRVDGNNEVAEMVVQLK